MFEVYELVTPIVAGAVQKPTKAHWGIGVTIAQAVQQAASAITTDTDGLIDHVNNLQCLGEYMRSTGTVLHIAYRVQYVVRYGILGSKGAGILGKGTTVALAMQEALKQHNFALRNDGIPAQHTWEQMVTNLLTTDYHVWVTAE